MPPQREVIESVAALRKLYPLPKGRAVTKQLDHLDPHCQRFVARSPFVVIASGSGTGGFDASPRGGEPGFVRVIDALTLWLPDAPSNNRLDTLENIIETGRIGLLFLIPGVDETLRVNGRASISADPEKTAQFANEKRTPRVIIEVAVEEVYLRCAKALMRSRLWDPESLQDRSVLPTMGRMLSDQIGSDGPVESQEAMVARYQSDL